MEPSAARTDSAAPREWWWVFDPRLSLRAAAALFACGGTVLLVLMIAWAASLSLHRSLETQLGNTFETLAAQVADKIDRGIYERYRTIQLGANLAALRSPDTPAAERRRVLDVLQDSSPDFAWIGLTDNRGRVLVATRGQSEGVAMGDRPWFMLARERPHTSAPRETAAATRAVAADDDNDTSRVFDLAVPVQDLNGLFSGVLAAQVRWGWTRDVQNSVVSETLRRQLVGITLYGANKEVLLDSGASGWTQPPDAPALAEGRRTRGNYIEHTSVGSHYVTGFVRSRGVREYRGQGWLATVRQPVDRAFAPVDALRRAILLWGFVLAIAVGAASWIVAGRLARRLRTIGGAADRIREGDILTVIPRPPGESELARMCRALGDMVDDFRAQRKPTPTERETAKH